MLSALQLHRKTIKFQKPDTTQGGIIFKARCCLLFSVLNKILRVGTSGWFIMNRDSVHMICRPSPWREGLLFTGYLTRRFLASSADAQSWPVKYCAASSHSRSLHAPKCTLHLRSVRLCGTIHWPPDYCFRQEKGTHRFLEKQRGQADHGGKSPAAYPLHWMIQLRLLSGAGKVLQKIFSMVKPHFFFICWDDNKKAEILSSNLRFNNYIGFSPGEGNQVSVLFVFSYG